VCKSRVDRLAGTLRSFDRLEFARLSTSKKKADAAARSRRSRRPQVKARDLRWPGEVLPREQWARTRHSLGDAGTPFDWSATFGRDAPRVLDLGCGNGWWLVHSGLARPEFDHLGVELVPPALRLGSLRAGQRGLAHVKFAWGDATEFVVERCPSASVDEVHLYHPQPYYEARRIVRRQLTPEVLAAIHRVLRPGGLFVFQTDNPAYMAYARRIAPVLFEFRERHEPWEDLPAGRTLREITARAQGLRIERACARPLALSDVERQARIVGLPAPEFDANKQGFGLDSASSRKGRRRKP
jgi:tRNA (guanine-N7-)-methyltransferase